MFEVQTVESDEPVKGMANKQGDTGESAEEHNHDRWLVPTVELSERTREVLEKYSKIPSDKVIDHVFDIRAKAWAVYPYPCIGRFGFLDLSVGQHTLYPEILERMKTGKQAYVDLGCAFAQDIRRLVADGTDSTKCYGSDLRLDFLELGYELFNDKETLKSKFIAADIFDPSNPLTELNGEVDIVGASSIFHLFTWEEQKHIARRVTQLLKPQTDSLVVGRQVGNLKPGDYPRRSGGLRYRHNMASWKQMWSEVGDEMGVKFSIGGSLKQIPEFRQRHRIDADPNVAMMEFSVRRHS